MSFLLRAALVIGALSYFALMRGEPGHPGPEAHVAAARAALPIGGRAPDGAAIDLPAAWNAVPAPARERIARAALAELARRAADPEEAAPRDTLVASDRQPAWRGVEGRTPEGR